MKRISFLSAVFVLVFCAVSCKIGEEAYVISFDANGGKGTVPDSITVEYGDYYTLPYPYNLSKSGYVFDMWSTSPNVREGHTLYADQETSWTTRDIDGLIFYAVWKDSGLFSYSYLEESDSYSIACKDSSISSVEIPSDYEGKPITTIKASAFADNSCLEEVIIPDTVTTIEKSAFENCISLRNIEIPASVKTIGKSAFKNCKALTKIVIPKSVETIGRLAFSDCENLKKVTFSGSVYIGQAAFHSCSALESITFSSSDKAATIDEYAFFNCSKLKNISIPSNYTAINSCAFASCSSLESITVANGNTTYYSSNNCLIEKTTKVLIAGCKNSIIPADVTAIWDYAFFRMSGLTSITIPTSVTRIEGKALAVSDLTINYEGSEAQWEKISKASNWAGDYTPTITYKSTT